MSHYSTVCSALRAEGIGAEVRPCGRGKYVLGFGDCDIPHGWRYLLTMTEISEENYEFSLEVTDPAGDPLAMGTGGLDQALALCREVITSDA